MKRLAVTLIVAAAFLTVPTVALAANCSVSPSPAPAGSTVFFHADHLSGDNYLSVTYFSGGFGWFLDSFDLESNDPVDMPYTIGEAGTYSFMVAHANGASHGNNIGHGYIQCLVSAEVF